MKLSPLLAQFLYTNKQLVLAGIGRFTIDDTVVYEDPQGKANKTIPPPAINFEQDPSVKQDTELIAFISSQSGKMKSLAAADLDSYMEQARQFLNIGKPFLFEGIGTLVKSKSGKYDFTQGEMLTDKIKDAVPGDAGYTSGSEKSFTDYEEMFSAKKPATGVRKKITVWLAVIAGIGLALLGGYLVYNNSKPAAQVENKKEHTGKAEPVKTPATLPDTSIIARSQTSIPPAYRFIVEQSGRERAIARYNYLKKWGIDIRMETKDSVTFKLFFLLPATPSDTARIRDSLGLLYTTIGRPAVE